MVAPRVKRDVGLNFFRNERSKTFGKIEKGNHMEKKRSDLRKLRSLLPWRGRQPFPLQRRHLPTRLLYITYCSTWALRGITLRISCLTEWKKYLPDIRLACLRKTVKSIMINRSVKTQSWFFLKAGKTRCVHIVCSHEINRRCECK
jgi:hypothetical protein